jgi:HSP20 family protein
MLAKWDPIRELLNAEDDFDRLVGRQGMRHAWAPPLDVQEDEDRFAIRMDLPGITPEDVQVTFENGVLTVSGKREMSAEEQGATFHRIERSYGSFARSLRLPRTADGERIEAAFDNGVLSITVPKAEAAKPRTIEVKSS